MHPHGVFWRALANTSSAPVDQFSALAEDDEIWQFLLDTSLAKDDFSSISPGLTFWLLSRENFQDLTNEEFDYNSESDESTQTRFVRNPTK